MTLLLDTNILLRMAQPASPQHTPAKAAVLALVGAEHGLCVVPQVIYEFWVAATRPVSANGLGMNADAAQQSIAGILRSYRLLRDERGIYDRWEHLVRDHAVMGKAAHDARLVSAMLRHGISTVLTFNQADFVRFSQIQTLTPAEVVEKLLVT